MSAMHAVCTAFNQHYGPHICMHFAILVACDTVYTVNLHECWNTGFTPCTVHCTIVCMLATPNGGPGRVDRVVVLSTQFCTEIHPCPQLAVALGMLSSYQSDGVSKFTCNFICHMYFYTMPSHLKIAENRSTYGSFWRKAKLWTSNNTQYRV